MEPMMSDPDGFLLSLNDQVHDAQLRLNEYLFGEERRNCALTALGRVRQRPCRKARHVCSRSALSTVSRSGCANPKHIYNPFRAGRISWFSTLATLAHARFRNGGAHPARVPDQGTLSDAHGC